MKKISKEERDAYYFENPFTIERDKVNGLLCIAPTSVRNDVINCSDGNEKVGGRVGNYNLPVAYSCVADCECHKEKKCYACSGCYRFTHVQLAYSENMAYLMRHTWQEFANEMIDIIHVNKWNLFRYFACGDIPYRSFIDAVVMIGNNCSETRFWLYTKKYNLVNSWVREHGIDAIPSNVVIIFSHWRNDDGTFYPMDNPYNFPTSEFIPVGHEEEAETVTHICPCSDPDIIANCKTCDHPCYELKHGESMALLEHSTSASKVRDKEIKEAHRALKEAKKAEKRANRKAKKTA